MTSVSSQRPSLRRLVVAVPVVAVLAMLSTAAVVSLVDGPGTDLAAVDAPVEPGGTPGGGPGPETSAPPATPTTPDQAALIEVLPDALPDAGAYATSTVRPDGVVEVVEYLRTSEPTTSLTLSLPLGSPSSSTADGVVVASTEGRASGPSQVTSSGSYLVGTPATVFVASYLLDGATRVSPSSQNRALVRPVVLTMASDGPEGNGGIGPRLIDIGSGTVLALACAIRGRASDLEPCGAPVGDDGWRVTLDATRWSTLVAAQVDLE